jgi:AraC-like DNA-binding protein
LYGYLTDLSGPELASDAVVVTSGRAPRLIWRIRLGGVVGCLFRGGPVEVVPHHASPDVGLAVGYVSAGRVVVAQGGRTLEIGPGQVALYNAATPYKVSADDTHTYLVVRIPSPRLRVHDLDSDPAFAADLSPYPSTAVLAALLRTITELSGTPTASAAQYLGDAVADCVHAVLAEHHLHVSSSQPSELFARMTAWLDDRLGNASLSADDLALGLFVTPRYVRKVFAKHGATVSAYVRQRRLEEIRRELLDSRNADEPISGIATRWGLRDASVFSRAFAKEYGESPRQFRNRHKG